MSFVLQELGIICQKDIFTWWWMKVKRFILWKAYYHDLVWAKNVSLLVLFIIWAIDSCTNVHDNLSNSIWDILEKKKSWWHSLKSLGSLKAGFICWGWVSAKHFIRVHSIFIEIFLSGPKWYTDRPMNRLTKWIFPPWATLLLWLQRDKTSEEAIKRKMPQEDSIRNHRQLQFLLISDTL